MGFAVKFDDLPVFKLPQQDLIDLQSFDGMIEKIKRTEKMIFSFVGIANDEDKINFEKHFKKIGEVFETKSCIPDYSRMNLEIDINIFDAFKTMSIEKVVELLNKHGMQSTLKNPDCSKIPMLIALSKKFKIALACTSTANRHYVLVDNDTSSNNSFSSCSFGYQICHYLTGYNDSNKKWMNRKWLDNHNSPLHGDEYFYSLTFTYHGPFNIDMPIASSTKDLALICPLHELTMLKKAIHDKENALKDVQSKYDQAEDLVDQMLVDFDVNFGV